MVQWEAQVVPVLKQGHGQQLMLAATQVQLPEL
jgi:hypothetical protein